MKPFITAIQQVLFYSASEYVSYWEACGKPKEIIANKCFLKEGFLITFTA